MGATWLSPHLLPCAPKMVPSGEGTFPQHQLSWRDLEMQREAPKQKRNFPCHASLGAARCLGRSGVAAPLLAQHPTSGAGPGGMLRVGIQLLGNSRRDSGRRKGGYFIKPSLFQLLSKLLRLQGSKPPLKGCPMQPEQIIRDPK